MSEMPERESPDYGAAIRQLGELMHDLTEQQGLCQAECEAALVAIGGYAVGVQRDTVRSMDLVEMYNKGVGVGIDRMLKRAKESGE